MLFFGDDSDGAFVGKEAETVSGTYGQEVFQDYILYKESYDISCSCLGPPGKCKKTSETI